MSSTQSQIKITAFLGVFEDKLTKVKNKIQKEFSKAKNDRDIAFLKRELKIAKDLRKTVRELRKATAIHCPHCGKEINLEQVNKS